MADDPQHTRHASIRLDALGGGTVEVGGHDISDAVRGFTLTGEVGHMPRLGLDLRVFTSEVEGDVQVHIPDETAATLAALGWTPPPRLVKVDGVLTEGDADTAREALRQMNADPHGLQAGMIVKPYTERGQHKWVFRCWGTDTCDGWLSLDHGTQTSAESARDRHVAEAHPDPTPTASTQAVLLCVCGEPVEAKPDGWQHQGDGGAQCIYRPAARPRCPDCGMPHDLTPGTLPVAACVFVRERIAKEDAVPNQPWSAEHKVTLTPRRTPANPPPPPPPPQAPR